MSDTAPPSAREVARKFAREPARDAPIGVFDSGIGGLSVLRALSWTYFKVFEPLGLALWSTHDPLAQLQGMGFACERRKVFFGNFQVITATKPAA